MDEKLLERLRRQISGHDILQGLAEILSPTDLQSLLLEVYERRAAGLSLSEVARQYESNRFLQPSGVDPLDLLYLDRLAFSNVPDDCACLELSPVAPFGVVSAMGPVSQNIAVTTVRNTEVCSDSTNVLALEAAKRRRALLQADPRSTERVSLCASHRFTRAQVFHGPASVPHFRVFAFCTAGRDEGHFRFECQSLLSHLRLWLTFLTGLDSERFEIANLRTVIIFYDSSSKSRVEEQVVGALTDSRVPTSIELCENVSDGGGYYTSMRYQIYATSRSDGELMLVDGGFTDWTQKLLGSRKERFLSGGVGSERLAMCFRK
jgi:hypothetical protein